jgi:hypothetical protein
MGQYINAELMPSPHPCKNGNEKDDRTILLAKSGVFDDYTALGPSLENLGSGGSLQNAPKWCAPETALHRTGAFS